MSDILKLMGMALVFIVGILLYGVLAYLLGPEWMVLMGILLVPYAALVVVAGYAVIYKSLLK